jgi:hypothetical protein
MFTIVTIGIGGVDKRHSFSTTDREVRWNVLLTINKFHMPRHARTDEPFAIAVSSLLRIVGDAYRRKEIWEPNDVRFEFVMRDWMDSEYDLIS